MATNASYNQLDTTNKIMQTRIMAQNQQQYPNAFSQTIVHPNTTQQPYSFNSTNAYVFNTNDAQNSQQTIPLNIYGPAESLIVETNESDDDLATKVSNLEQSITALKTKVVGIATGFRNLTKEVVKMNTTLESMYREMCQNPKKKIDSTHADEIENEASFDFPIMDLDHANKFEQFLQDSSSNAALKDKFSRELGTNIGHGMGRKCVAFSLADKMFSRKFFINFTWTGLSALNEEKHSFRKLTNTVTFFWEVVHQADVSYDENDNRQFFQSIMNNAKSRSERPEPVRRSVAKRRPPNLNYKPKSPKAMRIDESQNNHTTNNSSPNLQLNVDLTNINK